MTLQAYIDESGAKGTGRWLMVGGLCGSAETLARIADDWDKELRSRTPNRIRYFKADEARGLSGEFSDWRKEHRDRKVKRLASLVDRDDLTMLLTSVELPAHRTMESFLSKTVSDAQKHLFNQPYLLAFHYTMFAVSLEAYYAKSGKPEVVFDDHAMLRPHARAAYEIMLEAAPKWFQAYMPREPRFRDDMDFVLLQAADLLMGNARMVVEKTKKWPEVTLNTLRVSAFSEQLPGHKVARMTLDMVDNLLRKRGIIRPVDGGRDADDK